MILIFLLLTFLIPTQQSLEQSIYEEINSFRANPRKYSSNIACRTPKDVSFPPLTTLTELEVSSQFQASTLATFDCPLSHETCPMYCHNFGGCSYLQRVNHFLSNKTDHIHEILVSGPKRPKKVVELFVASRGHCEHLLDPLINFVGANFTHIDRNVFVIDLAYIHSQTFHNSSINL